MICDIQTGNENPILRTKAKAVESFDGALESLVENMKETMLEEDPETQVTGIGLAANQIGVDARVILVTMNIKSRNNAKVLVMVNPEIVEVSKETVVMEEGCLSVPGKFGKVRRPAKVKVRWKNVKGAESEKRLEGWDARIFLHEFDHLEGRLFTDYL